MNQLIMEMIERHGDQVKVTFSLTGLVLDQLAAFVPEVVKSFQELAQTGQVEFLSETYSHSLAALKNRQEFVTQIAQHRERIQKLFKQDPKVFRNTELVYSDVIGAEIAKMNYTAMLAEGAKHVMGWKSPNYLYYNVAQPKLKVLLRNYKLSDDIAFRFSNQSWSEWPLTAEKYTRWIKNLSPGEEFVNLFMDYETFGEHQAASTGIFDFFKSFLALLVTDDTLGMTTPSEIAQHHQPIAPLQVPFPSSWADEERDLSAWLGNEMQTEAFDKLYGLKQLIDLIDDRDLKRDWSLLQTSDHFYYMSTKFFSDGAVHHYFNPYETPYDAFINYMNVLSDFILRLEKKANRIRYKGTPIDDLQGEQLAEAIAAYEEILKTLRKKSTQGQKSILSQASQTKNLPELKNQKGIKKKKTK